MCMWLEIDVEKTPCTHLVYIFGQCSIISGNYVDFLPLVY